MKTRLQRATFSYPVNNFIIPPHDSARFAQGHLEGDGGVRVQALHFIGGSGFHGDVLRGFRVVIVGCPQHERAERVERWFMREVPAALDAEVRSDLPVAVNAGPVVVAKAGALGVGFGNVDQDFIVLGVVDCGLRSLHGVSSLAGDAVFVAV